MKKILIYSRYFTEAISHGNIPLLVTALKFAFQKKHPSKDLVIKNSKMGTVHCRKNTTDFMFSFYAYEYGVKEFLMKHKDDYTHFLDIGACIGDYSLLMARHGMEVVAFEPVEENYVQLQKNIEANGFGENISVQKLALGKEEGTTIFNVREDNKGASSRDNAYKSAYTYTVDVNTLDAIGASLGEIENCILKIDAEGMEVEVLLGANGFIKNLKKALIIIEVTLTQKTEIETILKGHDNHTIVPIDEFNMGIFIN